MILDLLDYFFGLIKMFIYKLLFCFRLKFYLYGKYSSALQIRIWGRGIVSFGRNCSVRGGTRIRVNGGNLHIGNRVGINNNCCINCMKDITIGDNVILGQNVCIYDHNHVYGENILTRDSGFTSEKISIGNNVWIGSNCIILEGVNIGDNCVIGAGTIVNKDIDADTIVYDRKEMIKKEKISNN